MKKIFFTFLILCLSIISYKTCISQNKITFKVDMSKIDKAEKTGIRGSLEPLKWDKTTLMNGPDKNGIYSVTIDFGDIKPGTLLKYKYIYGNDIWENNSIGAVGNRSFIFPGSNVKMAPFIFNEIPYYDTDALLESVMQSIFFMRVFDINAANKNGRTAEDVGKNYYDFWKGDYTYWMKTPQDMMFGIKIEQAKYPFGEFKVIEDNKDYVKFKFKKAWDVYLSYMGNDGIFRDVTEDEISSLEKAYYMEIANELKWKLTWLEDDKYIIMTINSKP